MPEKRHFSGPNCATSPDGGPLVPGEEVGPSDSQMRCCGSDEPADDGTKLPVDGQRTECYFRIKFQSAAEPGFFNGIKPYEARPPHASPSDNCEAYKIRSGRRKWLNGSGKGAVMAADSN